MEPRLYSAFLSFLWGIYNLEVILAALRLASYSYWALTLLIQRQWRMTPT